MFPEITAWLQSFAVHRHRYALLLLEGPSRVGKTHFARSLTPVGKQCLELNCSSCAEVDLRSFRYGFHALLILDEIRPDVILRQRKLWQCGPYMVGLGASVTHCHAYEVCIYQTPVVMCSNSWSAQTETLLPEDVEWLRCNTVHMYITEAMWQDDDAAMTSA